MARCEIILFDSESKKRKDGTFLVNLKVTHQGRRKYFSLTRYCKPNEWNKDSGRFKRNYPDYRKQNEILLRIEDRANRIIEGFEKDGIGFSFDNFKKEFTQTSEDKNLFTYFKAWEDRFMAEGKISTASQYRTASNALKDYVREYVKSNSDSISFAQIDYSFLDKFIHYCRVEKKLQDTSISVYLRALRALFNKAIKERIVKPDFYPFNEFKIDKKLNTQTVKRAISKEIIQKIEKLEFEPFSREQFAKDIFLFTYFMRGINFVDIASLKKTNITEDRLYYIRSKTKKPLNVKIHKKAKPILDFYLKNNWMEGDYLFPIYDSTIHTTPKKQYNQRKQELRNVNRNLKGIANLVGEENLKLTTYVGRHTYANVLKNEGKEISLVSEALGHKNESTTRTYLKEFENPVLDALDDEIL